MKVCLQTKSVDLLDARQKQLEIRVWLSSHCNVYHGKQLLKYPGVQSLKHCSYLSLAFWPRNSSFKVFRSKFIHQNIRQKLAALLDVRANVFARYQTILKSVVCSHDKFRNSVIIYCQSLSRPKNSPDRQSSPNFRHSLTNLANDIQAAM